MSLLSIFGLGRKKRVMDRVQEAFSDTSPEVGFYLDNIKYHPQHFGNETASFAYGAIRARLCVDRGGLDVDVYVPRQPQKFVPLYALMERFKFQPESKDHVVNFREFFRRDEQRLLELGSALAKGEIPSEIADLFPSDDPQENIRRLTAALEKSAKEKASKK
jgi:hypothetical protein